MWLLEHVYDSIVNVTPIAIAMHDAGARETLRQFIEGFPRATKDKP